mgnify:FL=1
MPPSVDPRATPARLRLLIVTDEMEVGGTQRQIVHLARGLDPSRFEVTVLYFRNRSHFVDQLEAAGVRVVQIEKHGRVDLRFVARLVAFVARGRFDVIHAFAFSGELWAAVAHALQWPGTRPVLLSSIRGTYDWYGPLHWRVKRWVTGRSWRVIANSRVAAAYAREKMALPEGAIEVIYNGAVDAPVAAPTRAGLRQALGLADDDFLLLFAGRLVEVKDVATLVRAMARVVRSSPRMRLVIAGDGPQRAELETQARSLGPAVRFLGQRDDVAELIAAADAVTLSSRREGLSNVILEAMLGARPVIATRAGGNVELVEPERTGLLFEVGDDAGLAAAIDRLAGDPSLRLRFGEAGRERALAAFSLPAMIRAFDRAYVGAHDHNSRLRPAALHR